MNKTSLATLASTLLATSAFAGVPLNNLQGTGGIAFNPLAYTAGLPASEEGCWISKPQVGVWLVNLDDAGIDWTATSISATLFKDLEVSYGYGRIDANRYGDDGINTHNVGLKYNLLSENAFDKAWVPAVSVGAVYKRTDSKTVDALGLDNDGLDYYIVATKLIKETPIPVLLSAGLQYTDEVVNGVVGHSKYGLGWFANIDFIPLSNLAVGFEYKSKVDVGNGIENSAYYDIHAAWFVNEKLTLVGAWAYTGDKDKFARGGSAKDLGVGGGLVFSAQYQF